jgi:hypothetical protein
MGIRIGAAFRLGRHVWIGASVPIGHARRLAAHRGQFRPDRHAARAGVCVGVLASVLGTGVGHVGGPLARVSRFPREG